MSSLEAIFDRLEATEIPFPPIVQDLRRSRTNNLTMFSGVAMQALEIAKDPDCNIDEFVKIVERDEVLALETLKMANSIRFGGSRKEMNLRKAVVRIGFRNCKSLIIEAGLSSLMKKTKAVEASVREALWRHSLTTAWIGIHLNRSLKMGFQGEEFTGGLVHDVGRLLIAVWFPGNDLSFGSMDQDESAEILLREHESIGTNHCELGLLITQQNALPEPLIDVARFHHCPERSQHHRRFVALVSASEHMANHLCRTDGNDDYEPGKNLAIELLETCGIAHAVTRFSEVAAEVLANSRRDIQAALAS